MKQLLLIEDDLTLGRGIALALADEERQCQTAGSLAEGRKVLSAGCWDLVILDLNLPDGSGLELLPWLRWSWGRMTMSPSPFPWRCCGPGSTACCAVKPPKGR